MPRSKRQGSPIPEDWQPDVSIRTWMGNTRPELLLYLDALREEFVDYWLAATGPRALKADWNAAFRTWCRRTSLHNLARQYGNGRSMLGLEVKDIV